MNRRVLYWIGGGVLAALVLTCVPSCLCVLWWAPWSERPAALQAKGGEAPKDTARGGIAKLREQAGAVRTLERMKDVAMAQHVYHDIYKSLPQPKYQRGPDQIELSWRVLILPFIGENPRYAKFDLAAAWDSPQNRALLEPVPPALVLETRPAPKGSDTYIQLFTGRGTAWPDNTKRGIASFAIAGMHQTILFAEAAEPVSWSKPADMAINAQGPLPLPPGTVLVGLADVSVRTIDRRRVSDAVLRQWLDPAKEGPRPSLDDEPVK